MNPANRSKRSLQNYLRRKKSKDLKRSRLAKQPNDESDVEIVEHKPEIIVIDDDDTKESRSQSSISISISDKTNDSITMVEEVDSSVLFYEDRNPGLSKDFTVPLYTTIDISTKSNCSQETKDMNRKMPQFNLILTKRFNSGITSTSTPQKPKDAMSISAITVNESAIETTANTDITNGPAPSEKHSFDKASSLSKSNVQITIQTSNVNTRTCTITSNSTSDTAQTTEQSKEIAEKIDGGTNDSSGKRHVSQSVSSSSAVASNVNSLQVTISNANNDPNRGEGNESVDNTAITVNDSDDVVWLGNTIDDSVVFVSETWTRAKQQLLGKRKISSAGDFISLGEQPSAKVMEKIWQCCCFLNVLKQFSFFQIARKQSVRARRSAEKRLER